MGVLNEEIGAFLEQKAEEAGKSSLLFGFADASSIATVETNGSDLGNAISIACALDASAVSTLSNGLSEEYYDDFCATKDFVSRVSEELAEFLQNKGYNAAPIDDPSLNVSPYPEIEKILDSLDTSFYDFSILRIFAAYAGLGWVGKNGYIVTKHYGPAVALGTVFTDAPVECATEVFLSRCGRCKECAIVCPADAIDTGKVSPMYNIESMLDITACEKECQRQSMEKLGKKVNLCGMCVFACPYTKSYLRRKGQPHE